MLPYKLLFNLGSKGVGGFMQRRRDISAQNIQQLQKKLEMELLERNVQVHYFQIYYQELLYQLLQVYQLMLHILEIQVCMTEQNCFLIDQRTFLNFIFIQSLQQWVEIMEYLLLTYYKERSLNNDDSSVCSFRLTRTQSYWWLYCFYNQRIF